MEFKAYIKNNAKNNSKINENLLKFKLLTIEEGSRLKRYRAGGRGGVKPFVHRLSHIRVILEGEETPKTNQDKAIQTKVAKANKKLEIKLPKNKKHGSKS
jgi:large subunit ribosomal protein L22